MKIIYDNTIFNFQKYGGISRYFNEIIERIRKYDGVDIGVFKGLKGKMARFNGILIGQNLKAGKCDIYHPTYYSHLVKKRKDMKTIVTVHDMIHELYLSTGDNFNKDVIVKKQSIANADHLICVSNSTKKDLQKIYGIEDGRISVIYHGAPLAKQQFKKDNIPHKPYILYVGKRGFYKNFSTLLNAFYESKIGGDFDLVCFGGGGFSKEEMAEFKRMKLESSIKHVEGPDDFMQLYYENAHVFVYPSIYEGFGLPVLEAMAYGCPVIASNASSIPEITDNAAVLFPPDNTGKLCDCIKEIINDRKMRDDYIERGMKRAKKFSWDKTADQTLDVYRKALS